MKNATMIKALCIIFSLLVYKVACAQDYLVTVKNDTIHGEIRLMNYGIEPHVAVVEPGEKKKTTYSIIEIRSFQKDNQTYETVRTPERYLFMRVILSGYMSLYAFESKDQPRWSGRYMTTVDGRMMEVPNLGFKKRMSTFIVDCPRVSNMVANGEFSKQEIESIIREYNKCVAERTRVTTSFEVPDAWEELDKAVAEHNDFESKKDVTDMLKDIKARLKRAEKIPNFLLEGLKNYLKDQPDLLESLEKAKATLEN